MKSVHQCTVGFNKKLPRFCNRTATSGAALQQNWLEPQVIVGGQALYAVLENFCGATTAIAANGQ
jgi:hypothetical protein